ncbi:Uncharacterized protein dnm_005450 [Desulfonema magnum]|uniref:Uncharacterized protein n=2 Tax=Desulfonema magnum TaxID=45655 RepID=A0A975BFW2_9BACT|nr:Uncharacterized protein dnm_005450 [Desulfonema magnum]
MLAIATIVYAVNWYKQEQRSKQISEMTCDDLVDAIITREISILEVPAEHREAVNEILQEIQEQLDKS